MMIIDVRLYIRYEHIATGEIKCVWRHRRRSSVNLRGHNIFAQKIFMNNQQNARILQDSCPKKIPEFGWYLPEKLTKCPNFTRGFRLIGWISVYED